MVCGTVITPTINANYLAVDHKCVCMCVCVCKREWIHCMNPLCNGKWTFDLIIFSSLFWYYYYQALVGTELLKYCVLSNKVHLLAERKYLSFVCDINANGLLSSITISRCIYVNVNVWSFLWRFQSHFSWMEFGVPMCECVCSVRIDVLFHLPNNFTVFMDNDDDEY